MGREARATKLRYLKGTKKFINGSGQELKEDISLTRRLEKLGLVEPTKKIVMVN